MAKKKPHKTEENQKFYEFEGRIPGPLTEEEIRDIRMCIDVYPQTEEQILECAARAVEENPENKPIGVRADRVRMALFTGKKWKPGRTLTVGFLDGTPQNINLVKQHAPYWSNFCSIKFQFVDNPSQADVRVSFRQAGAWSYIGTDILGIPKNQCTMNFGFIDPTTIKHEFGHTLGCIHEHQHPEADLPWNKQAVYQYFSGPPNNWPREQIDSNIFQRYSAGMTQFSQYDPKSIMHYPFDGRLLTDPSKAVGFNQDLSQNDRVYIGQMYPLEGTGGGDDGTTRPPIGTTQPPGPPMVAVALPVFGRYRLVEENGKKVMYFE